MRVLIDINILISAALTSKADVLLTRDKDFIESGISNPRIMTAAKFIEI